MKAVNGNNWTYENFLHIQRIWVTVSLRKYFKSNRHLEHPNMQIIFFIALMALVKPQYKSYSDNSMVVFWLKYM